MPFVAVTCRSLYRETATENAVPLTISDPVIGSNPFFLVGRVVTDLLLTTEQLLQDPIG
jgi:hypothetical protein